MIFINFHQGSQPLLSEEVKTFSVLIIHSAVYSKTFIFNKLGKIRGELCILGLVLFFLFPRKLILVKIYLDFYYSRQQTSKPGHKERLLQGSPLNV